MLLAKLSSGGPISLAGDSLEAPSRRPIPFGDSDNQLASFRTAAGAGRKRFSCGTPVNAG